MALQYKTYSTGTLASSYTTSDTTLSLTAGNGANFPSTGDFYVRINNSDGTIRKCTSRSTDTLTLAAGTVDGTTDQNAVGGTQVDAVLAASAIDELRADQSQEGVYASRPSGGKPGDIYRTTDAPYILRWNGSSLDAFGPVYPLTPPKDSTYTTYLTGGSPTKVDQGAILLSGGASDSLYRGKTLGVTIPYTSLILGYSYSLDIGDNAAMGVFLRNSSSGKIIVFQTITQSTGGNSAIRQINQLNNDGSFHSNIHNDSIQALSAMGTIYLKISNDNTNRKYYSSQSPIGPWELFFSEATGTYITEDQWGYFTGGLGQACSAIFFHLQETQ